LAIIQIDAIIVFNLLYDLILYVDKYNNIKFY